MRKFKLNSNHYWKKKLKYIRTGTCKTVVTNSQIWSLLSKSCLQIIHYKLTHPPVTHFVPQISELYNCVLPNHKHPKWMPKKNSTTTTFHKSSHVLTKFSPETSDTLSSLSDTLSCRSQKWTTKSIHKLTQASSLIKSASQGALRTFGARLHAQRWHHRLL